MARINDRLLVQSPDGEWIVVMDESGGEEILLSPSDVIPVIRALQYFTGEHVGEECVAADLSEGSG